MSGTPYIDGATLDEAREAIRQGKKLEALAGILKCTPEHLARLLGISTAPKRIPATDEFDLFAADRLEGVL
jgi:hypothetical protein